MMAYGENVVHKQANKSSKKKRGLEEIIHIKNDVVK